MKLLVFFLLGQAGELASSKLGLSTAQIAIATKVQCFDWKVVG